MDDVASEVGDDTETDELAELKDWALPGPTRAVFVAELCTAADDLFVCDELVGIDET